MGIEDEDIHVVEPGKGLDGRAAGVAGGRAHDRHALPALLQLGLEELPDELHREILERERRTVEQLQQEMPMPQLHQWCARGMVEAGIGSVDQLAKFVIAETVADEGAHDGKGCVLVGLAGQSSDLSVR